MRTPVARFDHLYALHNAARHGQQEESFYGFTFNGRTSLVALSTFYGLNVPASGPETTLAEFLVSACGSPPLAGHRVNLGRAELIVQEVGEGTVKRAALRFLPTLPLRHRKRREPCRTHDSRVLTFDKRSAASGGS